jgi:hypothetical protein
MMHLHRHLLLLLPFMLPFLAVACTGGGGDPQDTQDESSPGDSVDSSGDSPGPDSVDTDTGVPPDTSPPPAVDLLVAPAFDPILGGPLAIASTVTGDGALTETIEVLDVKGVKVADVTTFWNGRDTAGIRVPTGTYTVVDHLLEKATEVATDSALVHLVRCGISSATVEDDGGVSATLVPMYWYSDRSVQDFAAAFVSIDAMEDAKEGPAQLPLPTDELATMPVGANLPIAAAWWSRPILTLQLGTNTILGSTSLAGADVHISAPGWTVLSGGDPLDPSSPVVLQSDDALSETVGVVDETLPITFEVTGPDKTVWTLGTQDLPIRWYSVLGTPTFTETDPQYTAWAAATDEALRGIDGTLPDHDAVLNALVDWVFYESGLSYDTTSGACAYTRYRGDWEPGFAATGYMTRHFGTIVNCSDCASIMGFYGNQLGAELNHLIILSGFALNQILAIGGTDFSNCPFGPYSCGFSYHAVTTDDGGGTIWDATLALDGDDDPGSLPSTVMMVEAIDGVEYLDRLVMSGTAGYYYESQGTFQ